jgi:hypothetical protein
MEQLRPIASAAEFNALAAREGWPTLCDRTLRFDRPELASLLSLWKQKAGSSGIPARADMTPRVLKPFLHDVAIYERVLDGAGGRRYRVRLMGDNVGRVMGDLAGKFIDQVVAQKFLPRWYASLDATLGAGTPLRFLSRSDTNDMSFLVAEYFSAPLLGPDGTPSMVLGVAHYDGARGWDEVAEEACRNLDLDAQTLTPVAAKPAASQDNPLSA